jgi:hypothetical protein
METIDLTGINYLAVVTAGLGHMIVGLAWYSRRLFGEAWEQLARATLQPAVKWMPLAAVGHMAIALVLAILIRFAGGPTLTAGLVVALLVWIGFVVTLEIGELVWEKIPFRLFLIRAGEHLVALSLAGAILGIWR